MKILVCITHVPDTTSKISFSGDALNKDGLQFIIGPYDDYALARAIELKEQHGGTVTVLNVGTAETDQIIRKALAIGADDAVRIDAEPTGSFFVAKQIAEYAKDKGFDLILMGRESIDFNGGLVHGMVGELLGLPVVTPVMRMDVDGGKAKMEKEIDGGKQQVEAELPLVAGCQEPIAEWKIPSMRGIMSARSKPLEVIPPVGVDTKVAFSAFEEPAPRKGCTFVDAGNEKELVDLLRNEAKVI